MYTLQENYRKNTHWTKHSNINCSFSTFPNKISQDFILSIFSSFFRSYQINGLILNKERKNWMNKTKKIKNTLLFLFCRYSNMQSVEILFHIRSTAVLTVRLSCVSRTIRADREWTNEGQSNLGFVETAGAATI